MYGASISIARDLPAGTVADPAPGFPAAPVTADLKTTNASDILMFGPTSSGLPVGIPATQATGVNMASAWLTASSNTIAQGSGATSGGGTTGGFLPFVSSVTGTIANTDFANSMMYRLTAATTFRVTTITGLTATTASGGGVYISDADIAAGKKAYILARVNYLQAEPAVSWDEIQGFIDFASQVGGDDS